MITDLNYTSGGPYAALKLTTDQSTPEMLKRAITLMLFSHDPDIRNFNGESVVMAFTKIPTGGFTGISFYLTLAAKRIAVLLRADYPEISDVYFTGKSVGSDLQVNLNIKLKDQSTTELTVYQG